MRIQLLLRNKSRNLTDDGAEGAAVEFLMRWDCDSLGTFGDKALQLHVATTLGDLGKPKLA